MLQQYKVYVYFLYYYVIYSEMFCIQHILMFAVWLKMSKISRNADIDFRITFDDSI